MRPLDGDVQLLAELLSVLFDGRYPALDLTPQRKKEKTRRTEAMSCPAVTCIN